MTWHSSSSVAIALAGAVTLATVPLSAPAPGRTGALRGPGAAWKAQAPRLLVVNKSSNTLSLVDPATREQLAVASTGFSPHEVALSADRRRAYVTDYGTGARPGFTVSVVDLDAPRRTRTLSLEPHTRPHGISVAPDGSFWVTTEGSGHVLHVDPESGEILQAVETGQRTTHMVVVAPERGRVVATSIGSGTATVIDSKTGRVVAQLKTGAGAEGIDLHPDGRRVYVTNREAGTLAELDLETLRVTRTLEVGRFPIRVRVRPDGREALVSNARGNEVAAVDLSSWTVVRRLSVGSVPVGILVAPDDRTAFVANTRDDRVTVVDLEEWAVAGEIVAGDEPDGMAWIPR